MKVILSPETLLEFKDSVKFYEKRKKGLGKDFSKSVRTSLNFISKNPLASECKYREIRVAVIKKFPFTIHYLYEEEIATVFVSAIFHTSQNPDKLGSI